MYGYIYRITDLTNGKCYIGQRKWDKPGIDLNYWGSGTIISNIVRKRKKEDSMDTLLREKLMDCATIEELNYFETYFIEHMNTLVPYGYNIDKGGNHGGYKHTKETKEKMKGRTPWNKGLKNVQPKRENYVVSKETKEKQSKSKKKNWEDPSYRLHMRDVHKGKKQPKEQIEKRIKSLIKFNVSKEVIYEEYIVKNKSFNDCLSFFGCSGSTFCKLLKKYKISKKN